MPPCQRRRKPTVPTNSRRSGLARIQLTATYAGFQTTTQHNITVNVGANVVVDFTLKPGLVTETVEVTTTTPVLESQSAAVGQVVDSRSVNNLPLNGRNFTFLAQLSAGVNSPQADTRGNAAAAPLQPMASVRRRTITCSMVSTTTPTRWTS